MSVSRSRAESAAVEGRDRRAEDRDRILQYLRNHLEGVPLVELVRDLFYSSDSHQVKPSHDAHYRFALRYAEESEHVKIDRGLDVLQVEPRPSAFQFAGSKQVSKPQDGGGDGENRTPKEFSRRYLSKVWGMETDENRGERGDAPAKDLIEDQFLEYLRQIKDRYSLMEHRDLDQWLLVPYSTRFNSKSRVKDNWRRFQKAFENASREYDEGVFLTLTTDPKKFDNVLEMTEEISKNWNRLMSWLSTDSQLGHRPDFIKVLEWTEKGRPHLHVLIFGVDWLAPQRRLSRYWNQYQAENVDVRRAYKETEIGRDGELSYKWYSSDGDERRDEKSHLAKYLAESMLDVGKFRTEAGDLDLDALEGEVGDGTLWKTAMFWATRKHNWSSSHAIKPDDDDELTVFTCPDCDYISDEGGCLECPECGALLEEQVLPPVPQYRHAGSAKLWDIPSHVRQNARFLNGKDPPGG